jgi:hypothetical protein
MRMPVCAHSARPVSEQAVSMQRARGGANTVRQKAGRSQASRQAALLLACASSKAACRQLAGGRPLKPQRH